MKKSMLILMIVTIISGCSVSRAYEGNYNPNTSNRSETFYSCKNEVMKFSYEFRSLEKCMSNNGYTLRSQTGLELLSTMTILLPFGLFVGLMGDATDIYTPIGVPQNFNYQKHLR